jgi:hypothetical protein
MKYLDGVPDAEINKITHENAIRHFQFDPFAHRRKERCTVEALRSEAAGWDVSLRPREGARKEHATMATDLGRLGAQMPSQ